MSALAGKVVIVTRAEHQAAALEALLGDEGATVYRYPCLAIAPPDDCGPLDDSLRAAATGGYDWLMLTSANTVEAVAQRLAAIGLASDALAGLRIAAVGPSTARAVADSLGQRVEIVPEAASYSAVGLAQALPPITGARVLLPQSALADDGLTRALTERGARVTPVVAYQPGTNSGGVDLPALLARGAVDAITLTSGSTAHHLVRRLQSEGGDVRLLEHVCLACVGPSTAQAVQSLGLRADVVASEHTLIGLTHALAMYFAERGEK